MAARIFRRRSTSTVAIAFVSSMMLLSACGESSPSGTDTYPGGAEPSSTVVTMIEPNDGVGPVVDYINAATTSIDLGTYEINPNYAPIIDALLAAQNRGVAVRILLSKTTYPPDGPQPNEQDVQALRAQGLNAEFANPVFSYYHAKFIMRDVNTPSADVLVTDFNFDAGYFDPINPEYPNEGGTRGMAALVTDPAQVAEIATYYDSDWPPYFQWPKSTQPNLIWSPSAASFTNPGNSLPALRSLIEDAESSLDIYAQQFILPAELLDPLKRQAERGVRIRIISNKVGFDPEVARILEPLGAQIRLTPTTPGAEDRPLYIHTKTMVADAGTDRAVAYLGSVNPFLTESLETERELGVFLTDSASIRRIGETFDRDFATGSTVDTSTSTSGASASPARQ